MTHDEITAAAFHESGHAIAIVTAFREAAWLPYPAPLMPVRYVEIIDDGGGNCVGSNIYSVAWDISVITPRYRPLMDAQTCVHLAGGVAEAIHRGVGGGGRDLLRYAEAHCQIDGDLQRAADVLADLRRLTGYDLYPMHYADRTLEMLLDHWPAVTALAEALVDERRLDGDDVEAIIDRSLYRRAS